MSTACIEPNPDIAGIGIRGSIYAQAILNFVPPMITTSDLHITKEELEMMTIPITNLVTSCAILISAFIQANTFGISTYHAMIILNLSLINLLSGIVYLPLVYRRSITEESYSLNAEQSEIRVTSAGDVTDRKEGTRRTLSQRRIQQTYTFRIQLFMALSAIHTCFVAGLGLWVWSTVDTFGDNSSSCTSRIFIVIAGRNVLVTSQPLRIVSLVLYTLLGLYGIWSFRRQPSDWYQVICQWARMHRIKTYLKQTRSPRPDPPKEPPESSEWAVVETQRLTETNMGVTLALPLMATLPRMTIEYEKNSSKEETVKTKETLSAKVPKYMFFVVIIEVGCFSILLANTETMVLRSITLVLEGESKWTFGQTLAILLVILPLVEVLKVADQWHVDHLKKRSKNLTKDRSVAVA